MIDLRLKENERGLSSSRLRVIVVDVLLSGTILILHCDLNSGCSMAL